ncbi:MAG: FtsW/RodA/SpoVE family cell cycle protein, partial [Candidatus Ventricola sp.]
LLGLYAFVIFRMLLLAYHTHDRFGQLVIIGVMAMLMFHVLENIGMCIGVMPITGIPLPFISYGGTNLVVNMAGIGLVLNVTKYKSSIDLSGPAPK